MVLSARRAEEVTQEGLSRALAQLAPTAATPTLTRKVPPTQDTQELVVSAGGLGRGGGNWPGGHPTRF